ncbi:MAG TPA: hypothetical protein VMD99_04965 [Terriglobales bacterium]|nr:hypothetical protein [Terriglobales bacterium]
MKTSPIKGCLFVLLTLTSSLLSAQDSKVDGTIEEVNQSPVEAKFASGGKVRMDLCPSAVELIGRDDNRVRVSYFPEHDENVKVRIDVFGDRADLRVSGCPHNNFQMTVEVPKSSDLYVRMFAGQMDLWGITGDKDVEMYAGQLTMDVGDPKDYGQVTASVLSGDLEATAFNVSKGGLFRSFAQTGPGKYRLHAHVGAGQLEIR